VTILRDTLPLNFLTGALGNCLGISALAIASLLFCGNSSAQIANPAPAATETVSAPLSPAVDALLRARKTVEKYFQQAANVVCTENVTQAVVGKNGKANYREESVFDYQLQVDTTSGFLKLVESRDTRKAAFRDSARTLLITNGFTSMLLVIHPNYEASYTFEAAGEETVDGVTLAKINFKAISGASSPAAFQLRGQSYPLPLSGTIWIEAQTGSVSKLIASVDSSLSDLGLQGMRSEIHYATVHFHDPEESYWMPISAVIDVETPRQHWRNIHRFAGYKRFRATIQVEEAEVKP
jgi:hypothetical protein